MIEEKWNKKFELLQLSAILPENVGGILLKTIDDIRERNGELEKDIELQKIIIKELTIQKLAWDKERKDLQEDLKSLTEVKNKYQKLYNKLRFITPLRNLVTFDEEYL